MLNKQSNLTINLEIPFKRIKFYATFFHTKLAVSFIASIKTINF